MMLSGNLHRRLTYTISALFFLSLAGYSQVIEIDSVKITPTYLPAAIIDKPYTEPASLHSTITRITAADIESKGAVTLIDALNYIPGGLTESRGRQVKQFFSVRGQKYPYPDYSINGVWQKEFEELPYFFSATDIEEINIIRSSAALLTGLSGMAGVIDIRMREYEHSETSLRSEYGTFNSLHTSIRHGNTMGKFSWAAGAGFDKTSGPEGKHAAEAMTNLNTRFSLKLSEKLGIRGNVFYLDGSREMALAVPPADQRYIAMVQGFDPYKALLTNIKLNYRPSTLLSSELQLFFSGRDPLFIDEVKGTTSSERDMEYGINYIQAIALSPSNTLRAGGLYSRWIAPNGKRFYTGKRCDTETWSAVITDEQRLGRLTIDGGMRVTQTYLNEYGAFNIEGDGSLFKNVTPLSDIWEKPLLQASLGATYVISKNGTVFLNGSAGQIKPRAGTLNTDMEVPGTEIRTKADLGVIFRHGESSSITATMFMVSQDNAIVLSGTTVVDSETFNIRELYLNRDQRSWGAELEYLPGTLFNFLTPFINLTIMKGVYEENGEMVKDREHPAVISSGGINARLKGFDMNIYIRYVSDYENDRFVPLTAGPQPLGGFVAADFNAGYSFGNTFTKRVYIRIRNIGDNHYSTVNGYPDQGRMIYGGLDLSFGKKSGSKAD